MIEAQFAGTCPTCELPIGVNERITHDGESWVHWRCPPRPSRPRCRICSDVLQPDGSCDSCG